MSKERYNNITIRFKRADFLAIVKEARAQGKKKSEYARELILNGRKAPHPACGENALSRPAGEPINSRQGIF